MPDYRNWSEVDLRRHRGEALAACDYDTAEAIEHELCWRQHRRYQSNPQRRSA
jgi:hypothetical protein